MKIAFATPVDPHVSGISTYSEELLAALALETDTNELSIDVFGDGPAWSRHRTTIRPLSDLEARAGEYGGIVYQIGNSPACSDIYDLALRLPGIVVLHEFVLLHLRLWMALHRNQETHLLDEVRVRYGSEAVDVVMRASEGQFSDRLFECPLSEEIIGTATQLVVHSESMAARVRAIRPDANIAVIPMGLPAVDSAGQGAGKSALGLREDSFVVTSLGHMNPYKGITAALWAIRQLLSEGRDVTYLLIGNASPHYDPRGLIALLSLTDHVRIVGFASPDAFARYIAASDVVVNLRCPTAGETSASALRAMAAGVPLVVSRAGSFEELPEDAVAKIDPGNSQDELLLAYLRALMDDPALRAAMGAAGRKFVGVHHSLEQAASAYRALIAASICR